MKRIEINDLHALLLGATILGSGGGGDPESDFLAAEELLERHGAVALIDPWDLGPDDLVLPVAFMGAPLVSMEKLASGLELLKLISMAEDKLQTKVKAVMAAEIGGSNAFTPLQLGALAGLPVVDGDTIGRAFPELQMSVAALMGVSSSPAFVADSSGRGVVIDRNCPKEVEIEARKLSIEMGSSAAVAVYLMNGKTLKQGAVFGSMSRALSIGRTLLQAAESGQSASKSIIDRFSGKMIASGIISNTIQKVDDGFLRGEIEISGETGIFNVLIQNEYLAIAHKGSIIEATPDIIVLADRASGHPITSEKVHYGLSVDLYTLPAPPIWKTEAGLQRVGPNVFGYGD